MPCAASSGSWLCCLRASHRIVPSRNDTANCVCAAPRRIFFAAPKKQNAFPLRRGRREKNEVAIYHWETKVITRSEGRTACGAAAYMSCSRLYNDYDGIQHDYTRKGGLIWEHVFLPRMAPAEWNDRETLWNAVEANEKAKDSQLAREFIVALPVELDASEQVELLTNFIQSVFVADGMCADASLHDTDGHNPHAHILVTMRPLNEDGAWQYKTEKEYLCIRNDEERGFTAAEFKTAQAEGWEKQYQYKTGRKKEYLTPSEAEKRGLERVSKHPKATRYGRQNPITARWNSKEQIVAWRAAWADAVNHALERKGIEQRVDHRSHAERGIDEKPTVHEGASARKMEQIGFVADRCELNREIRADNALIRELKALIAKLMKAVRMTLAKIAYAMEKARQDIIVLTYGIFHNRKGREKDMTGQYQERYDAADAVLTRKIDLAKTKIDDLREQAAEYDRDELTDARLVLRQKMESEAHDRIKRNIKGGKVSIRDYWSSISDADALLGETGMAERRREQWRREERDHWQRKAKERNEER